MMTTKRKQRRRSFLRLCFRFGEECERFSRLLMRDWALPLSFETYGCLLLTGRQLQPKKLVPKRSICYRICTNSIFSLLGP